MPARPSTRARAASPATLAGLLSLVLASLLLAQPPGRTAGDASPDVEQWRPEVHFTPPRHFMNDPNGLVFFDDEYHLFYQHNPFGPEWGHMSWGHAVSRDLLHWQDLPLALRERDGWMAFSGGAVVDRANTSGLCTPQPSCLVAVYTLHRDGRQAQGIAVSQDRGRTWTPFAGNPVLDLGLKDFRDPNVLWHEPTRRWVMTIVVPDARQVRFFGSPDLKAWTPLGRFGPAGATRGVWECPALLRVPIEGEPGALAWVLAVSVYEGAPAGGTGVQYFVGEFDGTTFTAPAADQPSWADYGPDFYAAQHFAALPDADRRAVWLAWMSNWQYANAEPTGEGGVATEPDEARWAVAMASVATPGPWRGAMTIPRELSVRRAPAGGGVLLQRPITALAGLRPSQQATLHLPEPGDKGSLVFGRPRPPALVPLDLEVEIELKKSRRAGLRLEWGAGEYADVVLDRTARQVQLDRTHVGVDVVPRGFARLASAPFAGDRARLRVIVDRSSIEAFVDDGAIVMSARVFPAHPTVRRVRTVSDGRGARVTIKDDRLRPAMAR